MAANQAESTLEAEQAALLSLEEEEEAAPQCQAVVAPELTSRKLPAGTRRPLHEL